MNSAPEATDFFVLVEDGAWMIAHDGKYFGPFKSKEHAIDAAAVSAIEAVSRGIEARVLIEEDGKFTLLTSS